MEGDATAVLNSAQVRPISDMGPSDRTLRGRLSFGLLVFLFERGGEARHFVDGEGLAERLSGRFALQAAVLVAAMQVVGKHRRWRVAGLCHCQKASLPPDRG